MPRLRPVPLMLLSELASIAHAEWQGLPAADRDKLRRLAVKSRGVPANLTPRDRAEIKRILGKVDLKRVARDVVPRALAGRAGRR